jgi:hypothetical protein
MRSKIIALGALLLAAPLLAHHGGTSFYDTSKELAAEATVSEFQWTNPHVELGLDAKANNGKARHWLLELPSPPVLANHGWNRKSVQPGDVIKVTFYPAKSGASVGWLLKVTKADGSQLVGHSEQQ